MAQPDPRPDPLPTLERRVFAGELRAVEHGEHKQRRVAGWASRFNVPVALAAFDEIMTPSAFDGLAHTARNVKLLRDHRGPALASVRGGSLLLRVVPGEGLEFSAALPAGTEGDEIWNQVQARNLDGASIGFLCKQERWETRGTRPTRLVLDADIFEVSLTGVPLMPEAAVMVERRALEQARVLLTAETRARLAEAYRRTELAHAWATFADALDLDRDWRTTGGRE